MSGLNQRFAKPPYGVNLYREFKSLPLRQPASHQKRVGLRLVGKPASAKEGGTSVGRLTCVSTIEGRTSVGKILVFNFLFGRKYAMLVRLYLGESFKRFSLYWLYWQSGTEAHRTQRWVCSINESVPATSGYSLCRTDD